MIQSVKRFFTSKEKYVSRRTFTYFIPAPPSRRNGYQEKEFDQISQYLLNKDFDILDVKIQSVASTNTAGLWILLILGAKTQEASLLPLNIDYTEIAKDQHQSIKTDPLIEHEI